MHPNKKESPMSKKQDTSFCSACGQEFRRKVDYGDFSDHEVRCFVAEYCVSVTLGYTGWGVNFHKWLELNGIAKHDGMFRLIRLPTDAAQPPPGPKPAGTVPTVLHEHSRRFRCAKCGCKCRSSIADRGKRTMCRGCEIGQFARP